MVANAELSYTFRGMTRFTVGVSRDIYFSFEVLEPFYIQPGFTLSVTQQVTRSLGRPGQGQDGTA